MSVAQAPTTLRWQCAWRVGLVLLLVSPAVAWVAPVQFLDCPEVNLLGPACAHDLGEEPGVAPAPRVPEEPLFTLQTMRPDTPPLLLKVFNDPSDANIAAYKAWQQRYLRQMFEVERRLKAYDAQQSKR